MLACLSPVLVQLQHTSSFEKIQTITDQTASIINRDCHCQINAAYITEAKFSCDPQETTDVTFRAKLSSTPKISDASMIKLLHNWIISGSASLTIEHVNLDIDSACNVLIGSFSDPICSPAPVVTFTTPADSVNVEESSTTSADIIGPLIGTVLVAVVIILVVICALHIFKNRKQLTKYIPRLVPKI